MPCIASGGEHYDRLDLNKIYLMDRQQSESIIIGIISNEPVVNPEIPCSLMGVL
jgi:hypothetical protein